MFKFFLWLGVLATPLALVLTVYYGPALVAYVCGSSEQDRLTIELQALELERAACLKETREAAEARGGDGLSAQEGEARRTCPAHRARLLAAYAAYGQSPPEWLADPEELYRQPPAN